MAKRTINTQTIAWFVDLINRGLVDLDPSYQRRSVWTKPYKRYFIDTIMRNFPSPPIFLDVKTDSSGKTRYAVVDGKQRLLSILEFIEGKIALPDDFGDVRLDGKYFNELSTELKSTFWSYEIPVENISPSSVEEINQTFDRLNRNVLRLTPQELRHAKFDGRFMQLVTGFSEDPFWEDVCISTKTTMRRMRDIEFISDLFLLTISGVQTSNKDSLDEAYATYDVDILDEENHVRRFWKVKGIIEELDLDICSTRLRYFSDFYTLWSVVLEFIDRNIDLKATKTAITEFLTKLDEIRARSDEEEEIDPEERKFYEYSRAISAQPNQARNREKRKDIFMELIKTNDSST